MAKFKNKYRIESNRLPHYDYSQPGAYFITIVTHNRQCIFGHIENKKMILNDIGKIAEQCWLEIPTHFPNVQLDEFVIMPNHIHGIIVITKPVNNQINQPFSKYKNNHPCGTSKTIGSIIRGFKIGVIKLWQQNIATKNFSPTQIWQRNYHDHIIRNDDELNRIRQYIIENPMKWEMDENYMN